MIGGLGKTVLCTQIVPERLFGCPDTFLIRTVTYSSRAIEWAWFLMLAPRYIQEPSLITPTTQNTGLNAALTSVSKDTLFSHVLAHRSALGLDRFLYQSLVFCDPVQRRCPYYSRWVWCANQSYHPPKPCPIGCAR